MFRGFLFMLPFMVLSIAGCKLIWPGPVKPFPWLQEGYTTYYQVVTPTDTILNGTALHWKDDYLDVLFPNGSNAYSDLSFLKNQIKYNDQGILYFYYEKCTLAWVPLNGAHYLRIPVSPDKGDTISDLLCEDRVMRTLTVRSINSAVPVPIGNYPCFVFEHSNREDNRKDREYWNYDVGLVQYEVRDSLNKILRTYQLSGISLP